jgi:hypothetical protein
VAPEENARSTAPWGRKGSHRVIRSLYFTSEPDGTLGLAAAMEHAVLEVIAVPDDYTDAMAQQIAESVHKAGILETRARAGARGGPIRITWAALVEKGMAAGVLEQEDA